MNTTELAEKVCTILLERFPDLKIQHCEADDFFKSYYEECGFPRNDNFTPVWLQNGHLISWEAPKAYYWDPKTLDFDPPSADDEEIRINFLFLHDDGYLAAVDDYEGETHRLMPTPDAGTIAHYIQLFFDAGRLHLKELSQMYPPAVTGISLPFLQYPDDYSTEMEAMPIVPIDIIRPVILRHIKNGLQWLYGMQNLYPWLNHWKAKAKAAEEAFKPPLDSFDPSASYGEEEQGMSGAKLVYALTAVEQARIDAERPTLLKEATEIAAVHYTQNWNKENYYLWSHPCYDLGDKQTFPTHYLPIILNLSDSIYAPGLNGFYSPATHKVLKQSIKLQILSEAPFEAIPLELPSLDQQVENVFLQNALADAAPRRIEDAINRAAKEGRDHANTLAVRRNIVENIL